MRLKILSWNIWVDGKFDQIAGFLKTANADIIGLQEAQTDDPELNVVGFLNGLGYKHVFAPVQKFWGEKNWHDGPAIISKYDIVSSKIYMLSETKPRTAVRADIKIGDKILHVFSTHLVHTHQQESELQNGQTENLIKLLPYDRTIVVGDFNAIPGSATIEAMAKVMVD